MAQLSQAIFTVMALGYIFVVGFILLVMVIQLLSYYAAGKMMGSINDEFMSAFTLFGVVILMGVIGTLVNAVISIFLSGALLPAIAAFVISLFAMIYAVIRIYDLSVGRAILHLFISFVMTIVITGGLVYGAIKLIPTEAMQVDFGSPALDDTSSEYDLDEAYDLSNMTADTETETDEALSGGPKLPSVAGSDTACIYDIDCENSNDFCFSGTCQTVEEISSLFPATENCESNVCANCATGFLSTMPIGMKTGNYNVCTECDASNPDQLISCITGFTCKDYKCVAE